MSKKSERNIRNNKAGNSQVNKTILIALLTIALLIGSVAYILAADFASIGVFDINGQICADGSGIPDWGQCSTTTGTNGIFDATAPSTGQPIASHLPPGTITGTAFFFNDFVKSKDLTMYSGSNKNDEPISAWNWLSFSSSLQAKDDLTHVYTLGIKAQQNYPGTLIAKGDELLFIGLERISPSGDSHLDLEVFQSAIGLSQTPPCTVPNPYCTFTGTRTTGDIIITMEFVVGGSLGSVSLRQWDNSTQHFGPIVGGFNTTRTSGLICNGAAGTLCAENNPGPSDPAGPWGYINSHSNTQTTVPTNGFTEIGVDLTAITGTSPCISTILPKTRASQSFDATLQDFITPHQTGGCKANLNWQKFDNGGNLLAGATFNLCQLSTFNNGIFTPITPSCISVTDNQNPDVNPTGGNFTVNGLTLGNYTLQETAAPPGFTVDPTIRTNILLTQNGQTVVVQPPFQNQRPILKLSGFGYQNAETSTPSQGTTINGTVTYSITVHNYGGSAGYMNLTFAVTFSGTGTLLCTGSTGPGVLSGCTLSATNVLVAAGGDVTFTVTATYTNVVGGSTVTANLNATYNTAPGSSFIRTVNGSPATVIFTVQAN